MPVRGAHHPGQLLRRAHLWSIIVAAVAITTAAAVMALHAYDQADAARRTQTAVERISADGNALDALASHAGLTLLSTDRTLAETFAASAAPGVALGARLDASTAELRRLSPGADSDRLSADVRRLQRLTLGLLSAARRLGVREAVVAQGAEMERLITALQGDVRRTATARDAAAVRASRRARIAVVVALVGSMLLLLVLGLMLERLRRRASADRQMRAVERLSEQRIRALVEHASDVVTIVGRDLTITWQAPSVQRMLGGDLDSRLGRPIVDLVHPDDAPRVQRRLSRCLSGGGTETVALRLHHEDGSWIHVEAIIDNRLDDPAVAGLLLSLRDICERRALEEQLRHQAFHDPLTGLANRALFGQRLDEALVETPDQAVAILFLDLDDFKTINDSLGHEAGDELLRIVARRIASVLRTGDLASRQGGDEFAVLLCDVADERAAIAVADRLAEVLRPELVLGGRSLAVRGSIGLVMGEPGANADELLRNADIAMYHAKAHAKGGIRVFEAQLHQMAVDRLELGSELVHAIADDQLVLDYQPIVELESEAITGVEALVRWRHPTRGLLSPVEFIPLAEETGAIVELGQWVLEHGCAQMQHLRTTAPGCANLSLSVNVSIKQLLGGRFPDTVAATLEKTGFPARALVLELTESLLIEEPAQTIVELERLKGLGVRLAVDDFGTGHSVLSYLQDLPIDILKIDKSFVDTVHTSPEQAKLVAGIVQLSESLHMEVVAEGIEEVAQADQLRSMRSRMGQGYLYSRPVSPESIAALLAGVPA
jgi:diguanylate cyclase (GGDEF)-like protein/PAS domain S-box-containing protein